MVYEIYANPYGGFYDLEFKNVKSFKITKTFLRIENKFSIRLEKLFAIYINGKKESNQIWSDEPGTSTYKKTFDSTKQKL